jgi:TonB-linked SusC/RagA family outer membrane protein
MKKYRLYCLSLLVMGTLTTAAQEDETVTEDTTIEQPVVKVKAESPRKQVPTRMVTGRVINAATKAPLAGALVRTQEIEGYSALTEDDGSYEMKVPFFATSLEISAPDFNLTKVGLNKSGKVEMAMMYPSTLRADYTKGNNITSDKTADNFSFSPAITIEDEIQKQLGADVRTITRSGTPGIGSVMFMNGINSLNVNAQPLIVIDGVIFDQQYGRTLIHDGLYNDVLSNINVNDIEKVTVMKNGTALYGAKGGNGVILIQTRRNKSMATRISATMSGGYIMKPKTIDVLNGDQYRGYASEMLKSVNTTMTSFKFLNEDPTYYYYGKYHNNTDWKDLIYREAFSQNYGLNVEGGDAVANYNLSLGYTSAKSTLKDNDMDRLNIRFNTDIVVTDKFSIRFDASYVNQTRDLRDDGASENYVEGTPTSTAYLAYIKSPMLSPYAYAAGVINTNHLDVSDEDYLTEALSQYSNLNYKLANPLCINEYGEAENKNRFETSMVNLSVTPKFQFNKHLFLSEHFSYNLVNTNEKYYIPINGVPDYYVSSIGTTEPNEVRSLYSKQNSSMSDTRLDWNNHYDAHFIHLMGGCRINYEAYTSSYLLGYNTGNDKTPQLSSGLEHIATYGDNDNWNSIAWYGQAEYNYLQRYYLQGNLTMESSSRFGREGTSGIKMAGVVWGLFPSVQASWVVTNEPWFADISGINYLKLTTGYDISGNDDIDYYASRSYFSGKQFLKEKTSSLAFANIGNTQIQWETTKRFNAGFEGNFINNRLHVNFNYFNSKTDNLLAYQSLGFLSGLDKNWSNGGALKNEGFDVSASAKLLVNKNWQWELGASMGHYVNKVTSLPDNESYFDTSIYGATVRTSIGNPAGVFYGYKTLGVFSTSEEAKAAGQDPKGLYILASNGVTRNYFGAGDIHFADLNNDGEINDKDRTVIGDPNPDIYGNIFTTLSYKRFKLDVNFNYCLGNDVYNYLRSQLESGSRFMNQSTALLNRWQIEGQVTDVPKVSFQDPMGNSRFSDRWIEDGSYLKLKSLTLSYDLPINSTFLQGLGFWIQANNVFTITKYLGTDPEFSMSSSVLGQGIDTGMLSMSRSFVAGIKINL